MKNIISNLIVIHGKLFIPMKRALTDADFSDAKRRKNMTFDAMDLSLQESVHDLENFSTTTSSIPVCAGIYAINQISIDQKEIEQLKNKIIELEEKIDYLISMIQAFSRMQFVGDDEHLKRVWMDSYIS